MQLLGQVLTLSADYLAQRGVPSPRIEAELLLGHAIGLERLQVYLQHDRPLTEAEVTRARGLLARRGRREPLAHITGSREFWSREFKLRPGLLVPRPDSETLVQALLDRIPEDRSEPLFVVDLGCGSGCLGLSIAAERACVRLYAVDLARDALECTRENAVALEVKDRVGLLQGDLLAPIPAERPVDWIICNPPYIPSGDIPGLQPEVRSYEDLRALDGGADGLDVIRRLLPAARERARQGLVMELGHDQGPAVMALAEPLGFSGLQLLRDLGGRDRALAATC